MFKKATSSILEGIKNKMQKIDDSAVKNEDSDEEFLGLDDGFENLNVPKTPKAPQNNDADVEENVVQEISKDAPVKRNFNAEMEDIEKAMNSDLTDHAVTEDDDEIEDIEEMEEENNSQNSAEEEIEDLEDLDESTESEQLEELDELEEIEEIEPEETNKTQVEENDDLDEIEDFADENDDKKHEELSEEINDIEGDFHDFDLDVEDDVVQKTMAQEPTQDVEAEALAEELDEEIEEEPEISAENKDDDFADLDEEDHEKESDFEMKDVEIKEEKAPVISAVKQEKKTENDKSASDNFFGEFNEKEEIEIAVEDEFDDADEITFDSDEIAQKSNAKNVNFFDDADSQGNNIAVRQKDVESKKQHNEQSEEEVEKLLANTGIEESLSVENAEDISDREIELSFDDINTKPNFNNFKKMSSVKSNNENAGISSQLLSEQTIKKSSDLIRGIMNNLGKVDGSGSAKFNNGVTVEEMVAIMLQPRLEEWLNNHLPEIVEKVVREEVKKILPNN